MRCLSLTQSSAIQQADLKRITRQLAVLRAPVSSLPGEPGDAAADDFQHPAVGEFQHPAVGDFQHPTIEILARGSSRRRERYSLQFFFQLFRHSPGLPVQSLIPEPTAGPDAS